jgi:hypothetical protein
MSYLAYIGNTILPLVLYIIPPISIKFGIGNVNKISSVDKRFSKSGAVKVILHFGA